MSVSLFGPRPPGPQHCKLCSKRCCMSTGVPMLLGSCLEPTRAWKYTLVCVCCVTAEVLEKGTLLESGLMFPKDIRGSWGRPQAAFLLVGEALGALSLSWALLGSSKYKQGFQRQVRVFPMKENTTSRPQEGTCSR